MSTVLVTGTVDNLYRIQFAAQLLVPGVVGFSRDAPGKFVKVIQRATDRGHAIPNLGGVYEGKGVFIAYAVTRRKCVISEDTPKRFGGPQ